MRIIRITLISLVTIYIGLVVLFESWLGYSQPKNSNSLIITTFHNSEPKDIPAIPEPKTITSKVLLF